MSTGQTSVDISPTPRCVLELSHEKLRIALEYRDRIVDRSKVHVGRAQLDEMLFEHRSTFDSTWEPEQYGAWSSATEKFLSGISHLISVQLRSFLAGYQRMALHIDDETLERLPIETAHQHGGPALFELMQIYRTAGAADAAERAGQRSFSVETIRGDIAGLGGIFAEEALVISQYHNRRCLDTERMVHVVGHDPTINDEHFKMSERAHLVLSGCESLPKSLPGGVASATGTLWPIDDQTNAGTLSLFHSRIAIGVAPVEALRQAQILQRCLPPVVWAAYAHIGQPD